MHRPPLVPLALFILLGAAAIGCTDETGSPVAGGDGPFEPADAMAMTPDATPDAMDAIADDMPDAMHDTPQTPEDWAAGLFGLWTGPASRTPLGDFPVMNMDLRAADGRTLFGRFDLDRDDGLRFAFAMETVDGTPTLVFRNGGYFVGILRDTRTVLISGDGGAGEMRFCHAERGCDYLDARWRRPTDESLELTVDVRGVRHVEWRARRAEPRAVPEGFAFAPGPHDGPFPPLPSLSVRVTWDDPLPEPTPVWLLVSQTPCGLRGRCTPSRLMSVQAAAGDTEAILLIDQIHSGPAVLNAVLDRDANFRAVRFPSRGDGLSTLDLAVEIDADGTTEIDTRIALTVP